MSQLTLNCRMSALGTYRFYSVKRQTILLVNGEPFGRERVNNVKNCPHQDIANTNMLHQFIQFLYINVIFWLEKQLTYVVGLSDHLMSFPRQ